MVRLARDSGSMSSLYPPGITNMLDLPVSLYDAIRKGLQFASFGELEEDEQPPRAIWLNMRALRAFFDEVKAKRKRKASGKDDWPDDDDIEDPVTNPAAAALRKSVG